MESLSLVKLSSTTFYYGKSLYHFILMGRLWDMVLVVSDLQVDYWDLWMRSGSDDIDRLLYHLLFVYGDRMY